MWCLFLVFVCLATVSSNDGSFISKTPSPAIDTFIQRLQLEKWDKEESPCLEKTLTLLENVKNFTLWATWVWNANTVPTGNLYGSWVNFGNYDQCMKPPWLDTHPQFRTKYCIADMTLSDTTKKVPEYDPYGSTEEYLNSPTTSGLPVNRILWGVCMPSACKPPSITKITRILYHLTNYPTVSPNITVDHCQEAGAKQQFTIGFYMFLILLATLIILVAGSTYYRSQIASDNHPADSIESIISESFDLKKNYQDLVKENKAEIKVMNGMRFLTAAQIVILHELFYMALSGIANSRDYDRDIEGFPGFFLHLDILVDTFFAMSGLLHIKGLLANANRQQNLFMVLWKRYIRLIGPFAFTIFYLTSVSKYTGSGPFWSKSNELETEVCLMNWRLSLLMLNSNPRDVCHAVTWYLSCDYQLAILGTVLFYFYQKDKRLGFTAFGTACVFSLIIPALLTYWYQLPAIHFLDLGKLLSEMRNYWEISYTYTPSYSRGGAYLVGVAMGYLMTMYKPSEHRNAVSKTWSIIGTVTSLAVMGVTVSLGKFYLRREYYPLESAVVAATNRVAWAAAICCIIGVCEYGTMPLVSNILGWSIFTPLSRLSYGIYVIHPLLIQRNKFSLRAPLKYDQFSMGTDTVGTLTMSIGLSFVLWLFIEAPAINLCNRLLINKSKSSEPSKVTNQNGINHQNGHFKTKAL